MIRGALVLLLHHDKHHAAYVKNLNTAVGDHRDLGSYLLKIWSGI